MHNMQKIYLISANVKEAVYYDRPLYFKILSAGYIWFYGRGSIDYKVNNGNLRSVTHTTSSQVTQSVYLNAGDTVQFWHSYTGHDDGAEGPAVLQFRSNIENNVPSATFNISGNILSLRIGSNFINYYPNTDNYCTVGTTLVGYINYFYQLFKEAYVVSARNLVIPAVDGESNYTGMFQNCTLLQHPPKIFPYGLKGSILLDDMFAGCTLQSLPIMEFVFPSISNGRWPFQTSNILRPIQNLTYINPYYVRVTNTTNSNGDRLFSPSCIVTGETFEPNKIYYTNLKVGSKG